MPFTGPILDFYPQALDLIVAFAQTQLFAIYPLPNIEGNSPTLPTLSIPSERPVDLSQSIPIMGFVTPCFHDSNQVILSQLCHGFQLLLFIYHAASIGIEALQLGYWPHCLPRGGLPNTSRTSKLRILSQKLTV